jgi:hypothetical protein
MRGIEFFILHSSFCISPMPGGATLLTSRPLALNRRLARTLAPPPPAREMSSSPAPNPGLLPSLGRLVRGLSALFWGLPLSLIVCVQTAKTDWLHAFTVLPPLATTGLLLYGLWQLGSFQKQERPWRNSLDHARIFALANFGLSPFLYWWNRVPDHPFFGITVSVLALSALLFLFNLNLVLQRLGEMLPDEALRSETRQYTVLNRNLLVILLLLGAVYLTLTQIRRLPLELDALLAWFHRGGAWALIFLTLLPLAMTMALIWKTKEVILDNVFGAK